ncbi:hypothetical protein [Dactylosporangium sp. CA-139066]|uniref:hypothetical protein n=1 Tax=Dactylosporangium sp. CA-139066 TaxID=3239930 RepID=UPI003D8E6C3E
MSLAISQVGDAPAEVRRLALRPSRSGRRLALTDPVAGGGWPRADASRLRAPAVGPKPRPSFKSV